MTSHLRASFLLTSEGLHPSVTGYPDGYSPKTAFYIMFHQLSGAGFQDTLRLMTTAPRLRCHMSTHPLGSRDKQGGA